MSRAFHGHFLLPFCLTISSVLLANGAGIRGSDVP